MTTGCTNRSKIKTGDLLAWSKYPKGSGGGFWLNIVRFATRSNYGHVSVAVVENGELYHIEAVIPKIRKVKVPTNAEFWVVPVGPVAGEEPDMSFFADKIGLKYSILDAIYGYLGLIPKADDRWQCAEISYEFYKTLGVNLHIHKLTPTKLVTAMLQQCGTSMFAVKPVAESKESNV